MPGSAVSVSCTSVLGCGGELSRSRPPTIASLTARSVFTLPRDSPAARSLSSLSLRNALARHRPHRGLHAAPDRLRARERELLADDDAREALKARSMLPQRRVAGAVVRTPHDAGTCAAARGCHARRSASVSMMWRRADRFMCMQLRDASFVLRWRRVNSTLTYAKRRLCQGWSECEAMVSRDGNSVFRSLLRPSWL